MRRVERIMLGFYFCLKIFLGWTLLGYILRFNIHPLGPRGSPAGEMSPPSPPSKIAGPRPRLPHGSKNYPAPVPVGSVPAGDPTPQGKLPSLSK